MNELLPELYNSLKAEQPEKKAYKDDYLQYNPLKWAYMGDALYEIYVRQLCLADGDCKMNLLHKKAVSLVRAATQAQVMNALQEELSAEESDIVRRCRNAKNLTAPKNADLMEYRMATALEGLLGYLYLKGDHARLGELMNRIMNILKKLMEEDNLGKGQC